MNGIESIAAERRRQVEEEGWTPEHDDEHRLGELALAAALYAIPYDAEVSWEKLINQDDHIGLDMALEIACGWKIKPHADKRRRLEIAGALIAAEIDRLDRAAAQEASDRELSYIGTCECCSTRIYEGDKHFAYYDGPVMCAEHAPMKSELVQELRDWAAQDPFQPDEMGTYETAADVLAQVEKMEADIAANGDQKVFG